MELSDFVGQPCKSRVAFEFVPKTEQRLELGETTKKLRSEGVFVEIETPYLLMLKVRGRDVSLFKSGKMIVKSTNDKEEAKRVALALLEKM